MLLRLLVCVALMCAVPASNARLFGGIGGGQPFGGGFGSNQYGGGRPLNQFGGGNQFGAGGLNSNSYGGFGVPGIGGRVACRYWCKTDLGQAYCCEDSRKAPGLVGTKPGRCPPTRLTCPRTGLGPPETCSNDGSCYGNEKCCFDKCLEEHVCKPPHPY